MDLGFVGLVPGCKGQVTPSDHCTAARFPQVAGQVPAADYQDVLLCSVRSPVVDYSPFRHLLAAAERVGARLYIGIDLEIGSLLSALLLLWLVVRQWRDLVASVDLRAADPAIQA